MNDKYHEDKKEDTLKDYLNNLLDEAKYFKEKGESDKRQLLIGMVHDIKVIMGFYEDKIIGPEDGVPYPAVLNV